MTDNPNNGTYMVPDLPDSVRFELGDGDYLVLEIISTQLALEEILKATEGTRGILDAVRAWVVKEHDKEITDTQAWNLMAGVRGAFEAQKKKLSDTLTSVFGTGSTLSNLTGEQ